MNKDKASLKRVSKNSDTDAPSQTKKKNIVVKNNVPFHFETPVSRITPETWVLPNDSSYITWVADSFQDYKTDRSENKQTCEKKPDNSMDLFSHQRFVRDYLQSKSPFRGLLLYHGLGVGKTCSSIAVAEILMKSRKVVVLLPASLRTNYITEIKKCGNSYYNKSKHHWLFVPGSSVEYVPSVISTKNKGVWHIEDGLEPNYKSLSSQQKKEITAQIDNIIKTHYQFISYNGLSENSLKKMFEKSNLFDDKTIIIDEAHNFISAVSNPTSKIAAKLNKLLLVAKNSKIVLLSGTPIINKPFEIAHTINLIKGYSSIHKIVLEDENTIAVKKIMKKIPHIDFFDTEGKVVSITLIPSGYEKQSDGLGFTNVRFEEKSIVDKIVRTFEANGVKVSSVSNKKTLPFPTKESEFNDLFLDIFDDGSKMKNADLFMRKMLGSVSHFVNDDKDLYPSVSYEHVTLDLSNYQYEKYVQARKEEYILESKNKRQTTNEESVSVYKVYSRQLCNFSFPESIERPKPKDFKLDEDYANELTNSIQQLTETHLTTELIELSPKFNLIMENLKKSPGTSLVYSNFSSVEGVAILARCLESRGYVEMVIEWTGKEWIVNLDEEQDGLRYAVFKNTINDVERKSEYINILLGIFNNDFDLLPGSIRKSLKGRDNLRGSVLKTLFITRSGAEGISLKNVRQVHITEPYWNQNRTEQVVGRANRTCSHVALPKDEQNFTVFTYISKFSVGQLAEAKKKRNMLIYTNDKKRTTDELIKLLATKKMALIDMFLTCLKKGSVDCNLNTPEIGCYTFPSNVKNEKVLDTKDKGKKYAQENNTIVSKIAIIEIAGTDKKYVLVKHTSELFDYHLYNKTGVLKKVGALKKLTETNQYEFKTKSKA